MSDNDQVLKQFCGITGATVENAKFFLESSVWNLEEALASYYESVSGGSPPSPPGWSAMDDDQPESPESIDDPKPAETKDKKKKPSASGSRIATLSSYRHQEDSDEEEGQRFYAGGSTHSGQEVLGPNRANTELISELFRSVRELGGVEAAPSASRGRFGGVGYRLGVTPEDSSAVGEAAGAARQSREITLRLWRDGFTVNDEPLRSYTDPDDREFLRKIRSGQVPPELIEDGAETLHLNMEDHRGETYSQRPVRTTRKAFAGSGHMLGSVAPTVVTNLKPASEEPPELPPKPVVDDKAPTTTVSVRLNDGSRVQATLNHTHTIDDLRAYLVNIRPQLAGSQFALLTTFPSKELADNAASLKDAGVLNSSLMLRLK
ncbi:unnamed protein product [Nesidiocoris tenuis]|uniref:Uncharacterized protein n=1 Tax=Nesidiocoris tenuis TaxID=355587 RepID=A0A6H5GXB7_9HEMI|nr:unnamed protein product [Nesidiocoris tenuis]